VPGPTVVRGVGVGVLTPIWQVGRMRRICGERTLE
jgi:hypothetical protein